MNISYSIRADAHPMETFNDKNREMFISYLGIRRDEHHPPEYRITIIIHSDGNFFKGGSSWLNR